MLLTTVSTGVGGLVIIILGITGVVPLTARTGQTLVAGHAVTWILPTALLILITAVLAYLTGIAAIRRLGSSVASFVALSEVIFAVIFAALLLSQHPSVTQLVGGALILIGIAVVQRGEAVRTDDRRSTGSGLAGARLPSRLLQPVPVVLPPGRVSRRHVVVVGPQPDRSVNELADEVRVTAVPVGLRDHVNQDPMQRHLRAVLRPPRHSTGRVQRLRLDRGVGVRPHPVVEPDDVTAGLLGCGPHVGVGFGVLVEPWQRFRKRRPKVSPR